MTTALQCINSKKPYTFVGFELGIFCSVSGFNDLYAMPPGHVRFYDEVFFANIKGLFTRTLKMLSHEQIRSNPISVSLDVACQDFVVSCKYPLMETNWQT
jgi:hypothetical protein